MQVELDRRPLPKTPFPGYVDCHRENVFLEARLSR